MMQRKANHNFSRGVPSPSPIHPGVSFKSTALNIFTAMRQSPIISFFFIGLLILVVFGDGKQTIVDAIGLAIALGIGVISLASPENKPTVPFGVCWPLFLLYATALIFHSDDVGYSVFAVSRLFAGGIVFSIFTHISSPENRKKAAYGTLILAAITTAYSVLGMFFPALRQHTPPMNLVWNVYGHNHLSDLFLPCLPLLFYLFFRQPRRLVFLIILTLFGIVISFGRSNTALAFLFLAIIGFIRIPQKYNTIKRVSTIIIVLCGAAVILFLSSNKFTSAPVFFRSFMPGTQKQTITTDIRSEYFRQALVGFVTHPVFGSGPGTFYLTSKHLQTAPNEYSWYAHSFPLEALAEYGAVGAAFLFFIIFLSLRVNLKMTKLSPQEHAEYFFLAPVVLLVAGCFDYLFSYYVIWLLFLMYLGLGMHEAHQKKPSALSYLFWLSIFISAGAYYFVVTSVFIFPPPIQLLDAASTTRVLRESDGFSWINDSLILHPRNPDAFYAAASAGEKSGDQRTKMWYLTAVDLDPNDVFLSTAACNFFLKHKDADGLEKFMHILTAHYVPEYNTGHLLPNVDNKELTNVRVAEFIGSPDSTYELLSKLAYYYGSLVIHTDSAQADKLWLIAMRASPGWGYFHVEYASFQFHILNDPGAAKRILTECLSVPDLHSGCQLILQKKVPPPLSQWGVIKALPNVN